MKHHGRLPVLALSLALAACTPPPPPITGLQPAKIMATGQTAPVGTRNADAADDPAIWRNAENPSASLIVGTDKKAGIYSYGLDGAVRSFLAAGRVNNVDIVGDLIIASDRNDPAVAHLLLARLDGATGSMTRIARLPVAAGEAYGICISPASKPDAIVLALVMKSGDVLVGSIASMPGQASVSFTESWRHRLASQAEGCVFDGSALYVGEEAAGIWRLHPGTQTAAELVAPVDNQRLVADVEGLAIADGPVRHLIASSQGDNSYAVWQLPAMDYVGRFAIAAGEKIGATSETDGIAVSSASFGADYPAGLFIAQDGDNRPAAQNFKLVRWDAILHALSTKAP